MLHDFTYLWNKNTELIETENRMEVAPHSRGGVRHGNMLVRGNKLSNIR